MNQIKSRACQLLGSCLALTTFLFASVAANALSLPPRFFHKTLVGTNFVPILGMNVSGNVNPLDPSYTINSDADIYAIVVLDGSARN